MQRGGGCFKFEESTPPGGRHLCAFSNKIRACNIKQIPQ